MQVSLANLNGYSDVLFSIFEFLSQEEILKVRSVCKCWEKAANKITKLFLLQAFKEKINAKAFNFLKMVPHNLEYYFIQSTQIKNKKDQLSIKKFTDCLKNLSKKEIFFLARCFIVDSQSPHLPQEKTNDLAGRVFATFYSNKKSSIVMINKKIFFPIELFNLSIEGANDNIVKNNSEDAICFFIKGKLFEITIDLKEIIKAEKIKLTAEDQNSWKGGYTASRFYIPRLDSR